MKIEYLGHSCFRITDEKGVSLLTDPYSGVGYELPPRLCADILTVSHGHFDHNATHLVKAEKVINAVGMYETNGVKVVGIPSYHDEKYGALRGENIVFKWEMDGLTICHFGDLGEPCNASLVEKIGKTDILLIPVGGRYTIDAKGAKQFVDAIAPNIVIPMHYKPADGTIDITDAEEFLGFFDGVLRVGDAPVHITADEVTKGRKIIFMERKH
jgi:L-ascorbate metabolism protein UlaG (beta-lactamase superfamily)